MSVLDNSGQSLKLEPVPIAELLNDSARAHRNQFIKANIEFTLKLAPDLPIVQADGVRLLRLLDNLLTNARHHVNDGGTVSLAAERKDDHIQIDVIDSGHGMSAEDASSVFDRYYRGDGPRTRGSRGTGLGLPISRAIAQAHGGELTVDSREGEGSTFSIMIPIQQPPLDL